MCPLKSHSHGFLDNSSMAPGLFIGQLKSINKPLRRSILKDQARHKIRTDTSQPGLIKESNMPNNGAANGPSALSPCNSLSPEEVEDLAQVLLIISDKTWKGGDACHRTLSRYWIS